MTYSTLFSPGKQLFRREKTAFDVSLFQHIGDIVLAFETFLILLFGFEEKLITVKYLVSL